MSERSAPAVTHRDAFGTLFQSVVFPAPGWSNDLYYCSFSTIARVAF